MFMASWDNNLYMITINGNSVYFSPAFKVLSVLKVSRATLACKIFYSMKKKAGELGIILSFLFGRGDAMLH